MNREATSPIWDCIIAGAGPAGLNAALVLGRARWRVLALDDGSPRNYATSEMHGVLGHDGLDPRGPACPRPRRARALRRPGRAPRSQRRRGARPRRSSHVLLVVSLAPPAAAEAPRLAELSGACEHLLSQSPGHRGSLVPREPAPRQWALASHGYSRAAPALGPARAYGEPGVFGRRGAHACADFGFGDVPRGGRVGTPYPSAKRSGPAR
jgi:hypothetical protein